MHYISFNSGDTSWHARLPGHPLLVVLASDGLWNVMSPKDVVTFIHDYDKTLSVDVVTALIQEAFSLVTATITHH